MRLLVPWLARFETGSDLYIPVPYDIFYLAEHYSPPPSTTMIIGHNCDAIFVHMPGIHFTTG